MKKQLLLVITLVVILSGFSNFLNAQTLTPQSITCLPGDALHPIAGTAYTYTVTIPTPTTGTRSYKWMVTQDETFISNKVLVASPEATDGSSSVLAGSGVGYNTSPGAASISLTWKNFTYDPANPVFVLINVINDDGSCSPNNLKVYKIMPINAFTLDIANMDSSFTVLPGYGASMARCMSPIVSASYDANSPEGVKYDFGMDAFYYIVTAANFSGEWVPSVRISGLDTQETITSVEWSTSTTFSAATTHSMTLNAGTYTSTDRVQAKTGTVGAAGEVIYLRVIVDHTVDATHNWQGLTPQTVVLAIDGVTYTNVGATTGGLGDVHYDNGAVTVPCPSLVVDGFNNDIATQVLKARPDIQSTSPFLNVKF